jgi:hypothetical protein
MSAVIIDVIRLSCNLEIGRIVVQLVSVPVMHNLMPVKLSAKDLLGDNAVKMFPEPFFISLVASSISQRVRAFDRRAACDSRLTAVCATVQGRGSPIRLNTKRSSAYQAFFGDWRFG